MKKYLKLSTREAIGYFIGTDEDIVPWADERVRIELERLRGLESGVCVTITMPTHHSKPGYESDDILLRKLVERAGQQLLGFMDQRDAMQVIEGLREAEQSVDHDLNLDSLVLYADRNFSTFVRLPLTLGESVVVADRFDLRPLYRLAQQDGDYYVLTVSQSRLRLIEARGDRAVREVVEGDFPFYADSFYKVRWDRPKRDGYGESMEKEYYNDAAKSFMQLFNANPLPVVLAGPVKSVALFEGQMDDSRMVVAHVDGSFDTTTLPEVMRAVYPAVEAYRKIMHDGYLAQIDAAASAGVLVQDIGDMVGRASYGQADTLFIGTGFTLNPDPEAYTGTQEEYLANVRTTDNMLLKLLADVAAGGGRIVFMDDDALAPYGGLVMAARFKVPDEQ